VPATLCFIRGGFTCFDVWEGKATPCRAGPILVKALVLTLVERLHAAGYGKMYAAAPSTLTEVLAVHLQRLWHCE
jgi:drug/metabolite transporter superfamily protein YnfA